jgi:ribosome-associated protein
MANEFVQKEIENILKDTSYTFPLNVAMASAYVCANFKGENLKIFDVSKTSGICDFTVLATAKNSMQAAAIVDELAKSLRDHGKKILSIEGYNTSEWILLDTGDVIVHVFLGGARDIYDLDMIFAKNEQVTIPDEYYFSKPQAQRTHEELKNYF